MRPLFFLGEYLFEEVGAQYPWLLSESWNYVHNEAEAFNDGLCQSEYPDDLLA